MLNNDILKKLRVALRLKDTDMIDIIGLSGFQITKAQLSALFRKEDHKNFIECQDQLLRKFLNGLIIKHRGEDFLNSTDALKTGAKMNENKDPQDEEIYPEANPEVLGLLRKVLYKLDALEKRVEMIARQPKGDAFKERSFSKPYKKEYDRSDRPKERKYKDRDRKDETSSEGKHFYDRPFAKKKHEGKGDFKKKHAFGKSFKHSKHGSDR